MTLLPSLKDKPSLVSNSSDLLVASAELARNYWLPLFVLAIIPGILTSLNQLLAAKSAASSSLAAFSGLGALGFALILLNLGPTIVLSLHAIRHEAITVNECYQQGLKFDLPIIGLGLLLIAAVMLGLVLVIIPGIVVLVIILRRYFLAPYFLIDQKLSIGQALTASQTATAPYIRYVVGIVLVTILLAILSIILSAVASLVGILFSIAISFFTAFMGGLLYKQIQDAGPHLN